MARHRLAGGDAYNEDVRSAIFLTVVADQEDARRGRNPAWFSRCATCRFESSDAQAEATAVSTACS